jgi:hypothetical protein
MAYYGILGGIALAMICMAIKPIAAALDRASLALERFIYRSLAVIADPRPLTFDDDAPALALEISGQPVPAAVQNGMRHEAGVPKRAARRGI